MHNNRPFAIFNCNLQARQPILRATKISFFLSQKPLHLLCVSILTCLEQIKSPEQMQNYDYELNDTRVY